MREMRWASQDVKVVQFYARLAPLGFAAFARSLASGLHDASIGDAFLLQFYAPIDQLPVARIQRSGRSVLLEVPVAKLAVIRRASDCLQVQTRAQPAQTPRSATHDALGCAIPAL